MNYKLDSPLLAYVQQQILQSGKRGILGRVLNDSITLIDNAINNCCFNKRKHYYSPYMSGFIDILRQMRSGRDRKKLETVKTFIQKYLECCATTPTNFSQ